MKRIHRALPLILVFVACAREPVESIREVPVPDPTSGGASGGEATAAAGSIVAVSGATPSAAGSATIGPRLTEISHPGYRQPLCFDCHGTVATYPHPDSSYRPPDCVACHGDNGAPHRDHATVNNPGCPSCHAAVAHVPKLVAPSDCVTCHGAR